MGHLCYLCLMFVMLSRLFNAALWSAKGKGPTPWLLFVMFIVILLLSHLVSWDRCGTCLYRFLNLTVFFYFDVSTDRLFIAIRHMLLFKYSVLSNAYRVLTIFVGEMPINNIASMRRQCLRILVSDKSVFERYYIAEDNATACTPGRYEYVYQAASKLFFTPSSVLFCCFTSQAMAGWSVHLTTLFSCAS